MMQKKLMAIIAVAALLIVGITGAYMLMRDEQKDLPRKAFVIRDMRDRDVTIPGEIDGIIAIGACSLRLVSYFDSVGKVIAVDMQEKTDSAMFGGHYFESSTYRVAFPRLRELPNIGSPSSINVEKIISYNPDIVISSKTDAVELDNIQTTLDIPVVAINADLEMDNVQFYEQIGIMGKVFNEEARAKELVDGLMAIVRDLERRAEEITEERTAYVAGMFVYGGGGLHKTSGDYLPFNFTGVKNVMPSSTLGVGKQPYDTDIETLMEKDPEFVFIDSITEEGCKNEYNNKRALLDDVIAFSNEDIYTTLVYKNYGTNWENQVVNMYYVGSVVYSEQYKDVDIHDKAEEIWELFFQVELDYNDVADLQNGPGLGRVNWWA